MVEAFLFGLFTMCMIGDQWTTISTNTTQIDRLKAARNAKKPQKPVPKLPSANDLAANRAANGAEDGERSTFLSDNHSGADNDEGPPPNIEEINEVFGSMTDKSFDFKWLLPIPVKWPNERYMAYIYGYRVIEKQLCEGQLFGYNNHNGESSRNSSNKIGKLSCDSLPFHLALRCLASDGMYEEERSPLMNGELGGGLEGLEEGKIGRTEMTGASGKTLVRSKANNLPRKVSFYSICIPASRTNGNGGVNTDIRFLR
jgi:hypothetical protein